MTQVRYTLLRQLTPSRDRWNLKVRLSRMWTTSNFTTKEVWDLDMLFIDENEDQIHASALRDIIPQFSDLLTEGDIFHVEKFNVSKINGTYRPIIDGEYKIYLKNGTIVKRFVDQTLQIPFYKFSFIEFNEIPHRYNQPKYLTDIVGKLKAITEIELVSKRNGKTSPKRDLLLENVCGSTVKITVWDDMLEEILLDLSQIPSTLIVLIVTSTTVDMFKVLRYRTKIILAKQQSQRSLQTMDGTIYHAQNVLGRYKLQFQVDDLTGTTTLTTFEREAKALIPQSVQEQIDLE
ncbi:hypothetical protein GIB67_016300 [Kingdonia uniflora]|uniref:Replication protein A 70 kDa DNA-binding subunit B/D first OB fold domain-containing protein n=1 Tax=Kingdonia uniflora TaxID=39325 RepID=A0A7J7M9R2_9MAGN|nr:hypothetical protein GIB67_016300 [Kingdonia uniflora]